MQDKARFPKYYVSPLEPIPQVLYEKYDWDVFYNMGDTILFLRPKKTLGDPAPYIPLDVHMDPQICTMAQS